MFGQVSQAAHEGKADRDNGLNLCRAASMETTMNEVNHESAGASPRRLLRQGARAGCLTDTAAMASGAGAHLPSGK
jgi:hypothetical protein